jgi:inosine-uridine nucleoside N-ribohydrolase
MPTREVIGAQPVQSDAGLASRPLSARKSRCPTAIVLAAMAALSLLLWAVPGMQPRPEPGAMEHASDTSLPPAIVVTDMAYLSDDTMAILMLLRHRTLDIKGFVTTAGNVDAARSASDLRRLLGELSVRLPVVEGPPMAWHRERLRYYAEVERNAVPAPLYAGAFSHAVAARSDAPAARVADVQPGGGESVDFRGADFLVKVAEESAGKLVVVLLGPATVIAQALVRHPRLKQQVARIFAMGGNIDTPGNVTPAAEFNVWFDPPAMESTLASGIDVTLVPLDATKRVGYPSDFANSFRKSDPASSAIGAYLAARGSPAKQASTWDEVLAAILIEPSLVSLSERRALGVSTTLGGSYGQLLRLDPTRSTDRAPVQIVLETDAVGVRRLMSEAIAHDRR